MPSRVPGQPKTYVQDRIAEQGADVWRLLAAGGVIFVCGNAATMAPAVRRAFMDVFRERSGAAADGAAAQAWLAGLREDQRYLEDIWAGPPSPRCPARRPPRSPRRRVRWRGTYRLPGALPGPLAAGELGDPADRRGRRAEHRDVPVPGTQPQLRVGDAAC